jgi:hypothetical protein
MLNKLLHCVTTPLEQLSLTFAGTKANHYSSVTYMSLWTTWCLQARCWPEGKHTACALALVATVTSLPLTTRHLAPLLHSETKLTLASHFSQLHDSWLIHKNATDLTSKEIQSILIAAWMRALNKKKAVHTEVLWKYLGYSTKFLGRNETV